MQTARLDPDRKAAAALPARADPAPAYQQRLAHWERELRRVRSQEVCIAWARGATVIGAVVLGWGVRAWDLGWAWPIAATAAFAGLLVAHHRVLGRQARQERMAELHRRGLARLRFDWSAGDAGTRYLDERHPYATDLDLFGERSLFQLVSQARTPAGHDCLAAWLKAPATADVIRGRQEAAGELAPRIDLRERLAALGDDVGAVDFERLRGWCAARTPAEPRAIHAVAGAVSAVVLAAIPAAAVEPRAIPVLAAGLIGAAVLLLWAHRRVTPALAGISRRARDLALVAGALAIVEEERFSSPHLGALQARLRGEGGAPSDQVARLGRLLSTMEWQGNPFFLPIGLLLLWPVQLGLALQRWRAGTGGAVLTWLEILGEVEALLSLATYAFEHPDATFPEVEGEVRLFEAEALGHPLLPPDVRVCNDISFGEQPRLLVVTGSNMSGKSTMLRTVGMSAVLALAGGPVTARRLRLGRVQVAATLHIQDSLLAGRSRFFAEILKLRQIIELTAGRLPVLALIDELLHGTNSHDRQVGGAGFLREGLLARGAIGLISTHDQSFSSLADSLAPRLANVHFADTLRDGALEFDYRMRPGAIQHSNARALMRSIGIDVA